MPFCKAWFVLFRVWSPIKIFFLIIACVRLNHRLPFIIGFRANTPNKMYHTMWEGMKNSGRKWWEKLWTFLFEVTFDFGEMWLWCPNLLYFCWIISSKLHMISSNDYLTYFNAFGIVVATAYVPRVISSNCALQWKLEISVLVSSFYGSLHKVIRRMIYYLVLVLWGCIIHSCVAGHF